MQRPVPRPKTASSVPLRSWWRRSCRLPACGRASTRARGSSWAASSRAGAEPAEATAPYHEPAGGTTRAPKSDRDGSTVQNQVKARRGLLLFAHPLTPPPFFFFLQHHVLSKETANNSIACQDVHCFNPSSPCLWLCVIQHCGQFKPIVAASLICRASGY